MKPTSESLAPGPQDPARSMAMALVRLERSRANLWHALRPAPPAQDTAPAGSFKLIEYARAWLRDTPWGAMVEPLVGAAGDTLTAWWARQPWREAAQQARQALSAELSPWVQRHPMAAIATAAVAGAAVAASGVWRWRTVRRSGVQLAAHLRRTLTGQLSRPAVQSVPLGAVLSYLAARKPPLPTAPPVTGQHGHPNHATGSAPVADAQAMGSATTAASQPLPPGPA